MLVLVILILELALGIVFLLILLKQEIRYRLSVCRDIKLTSLLFFIQKAQGKKMTENAQNVISQIRSCNLFFFIGNKKLQFLKNVTRINMSHLYKYLQIDKHYQRIM